MNAVGLGLASVSVLLIAGAVLLFAQSIARTRRLATTRFVDSQLDRYRSSVGNAINEDGPIGRSAAGLPGFPALANLLLRAGVASERSFLTLAIFGCLAAVLAAWFFGGPLSAPLAFLIYVALVWFRLWWKADRRSQAIVRQLPGFLDTMVRLVTIGTSLPSAFQQTAPGLEPPLGGILTRAAQLTQAGVELDKALRQVARLYRVEELYLIAAVVGVSTRFGGRVDIVLERMSNFMRDLQQAREELVALSSETRLSAWILGMLPIGVAGFIVIFNNAMFIGMWHDAIGKKMLIGAVALQIIGSWLLYRLAKAV